ncbi:MAG TPA: nucleoside deaminase [Coriobacteriia bacterium]|nr:nucleoside deaminase [Coriobacteriia bacterium]
MNHAEFMRRAIELSREKMQEGDGGPFGAVVVVDGRIVGEGWNMVTSHNDPTSHAEVVAIREACRTLETFSLEGGSIYASCEPCPMCLGAIYWARLSKLYYANTTEDAARIGFDDAILYREIALPRGEGTLRCERLLAEEALGVFAEWMRKTDRVEY